MALERLLGARVVARRPVAGGYTNAQREIVTLGDGRTAFVKTAVDDQTRGWLAAEQRVYAAVSGPYLPRVLASGDDVLVLEDLSGAHWPPPWRDGDVQAVRAALDELHAVTPPPGLPHPQQSDDLRGGWPDVAADPERAQLEIALPWAARALGLSRPRPR